MGRWGGGETISPHHPITPSPHHPITPSPPCPLLGVTHDHKY
ncbi:MAG: hypothetical protein RMY29_003965 [Nostoc sp. CreGUA01]|nr:hypothetical protein [Nostoc sp. CreGUA01]